MGRKSKVILGAVLLSLSLAAITTGILIFTVKSRIPSLDGALTAEGLSGPVRIATDRYGIPHIEAKTREDLYFALGYVHARDRLFQMEFLKRIARGRLSELTGDKGLAIDRFVRTLQLGRRAAELEPRLDDEIRKYGIRYIDGINFNIQSRGNLPVEFTLMGFSPEKWTVSDLLTLVHLMVWDMHYNFKSELIYHEIRARLGDAMATELLPYRPADEPSIAGFALAGVDPDIYKSVMEIPDTLGFRSASNNWVVSGAITRSGKPILVEDPHGHNPPVPSMFYAVHLKCPGWDIFGLSAPGLPFFQHAYNRHVAYGSTTAGTDIQDLYIEKLDPKNPGRYLYRGRWLP
ncbi:MAG: penicillin acylase family protein, partial [Spirochaetes bacterium]|nr:penicillin acylase family protein [Spirochaetota bacterium]